MLPRMHRVKKKNDFDAIFSKGLSYKHNHLILKVAKNKISDSRFGFVVSLKVSKRAVARNKVRRRLAESVRVELSHIKKGLDVVFIALPGIDKEEYQQTKNSVEMLLKKAGVFLA